MARAERPYVYWTAYRRFYVAELLGRGHSIAFVAERLGKTPATLRQAVRKYGLGRPAEALADA